MKRTDLKVGEDYAIGSTSIYDQWTHVRAKLLEVDGWMLYKGVRRQGIIMELMEDNNDYYLFPNLPGKTGDKILLKNGREIIEPWSTYEPKKETALLTQRKAEQENARLYDVARNCANILSNFGIEVNIKFTNSMMTFHPDDVKRLLDMLKS